MNLVDAVQTKTLAENGAPSMSQVAAQSAIKKPAEDSLSPFSSDAEDDKQGKLSLLVTFCGQMTD